MVSGKSKEIRENLDGTAPANLLVNNNEPLYFKVYSDNW